MANPRGRPTKYTDECVEKVGEYIQTVGREQTELPTVEGFAEYINVDTDTINNWCDAVDKNGKQRHPIFFSAIKRLKEKQKIQLMNDGLYGGKEVNSTMAIFLLKANHNMIETEKKIIGGDSRDPLLIEFVEDKTQKYEE